MSRKRWLSEHWLSRSTARNPFLAYDAVVLAQCAGQRCLPDTAFAIGNGKYSHVSSASYAIHDGPSLMPMYVWHSMLCSNTSKCDAYSVFDTVIS